MNEDCDFNNEGVVVPLINFLTEESGVGTYVFVVLLVEHHFFLHEGKTVFVEGECYVWDFGMTRGFPVEDMYVLF